MKAPVALLLSCMIPACAFGQASNMISISALRQESEIASTYSRANMKRLIKIAHTQEEFGEVAAYFDSQAERNAARYESEKRDFYRLLALCYHAHSYSAQVENTHNRMDRFKALTRNYSDQAKLYRALANRDAAAGGIPAPLTK